MGNQFREYPTVTEDIILEKIKDIKSIQQQMLKSKKTRPVNLHLIAMLLNTSVEDILHLLKKSIFDKKVKLHVGDNQIAVSLNCLQSDIQT